MTAPRLSIAPAAPAANQPLRLLRRLSLVPSGAMAIRTSSPPTNAPSGAAGLLAGVALHWDELGEAVAQEWRWWAGAALALVLLGLAESLGTAPAAGSEGRTGEWLVTALAFLFDGTSLLRCLLGAALCGALLAVPWFLSHRSREQQSLQEARRIERSLYAARKKWWPRS